MHSLFFLSITCVDLFFVHQEPKQRDSGLLQVSCVMLSSVCHLLNFCSLLSFIFPITLAAYDFMLSHTL